MFNFYNSFIFSKHGDIYLALFLFVIANIAFEFASVFATHIYLIYLIQKIWEEFLDTHGV